MSKKKAAQDEKEKAKLEELEDLISEWSADDITSALKELQDGPDSLERAKDLLERISSACEDLKGFADEGLDLLDTEDEDE